MIDWSEAVRLQYGIEHITAAVALSLAGG